MKRLWENNFAGHAIRCSVALALLVGFFTPAAADAPSEYQVKALFLLNFVQFVEWPPEAFVSKDSPLVVGVLGEDPFGDNLENAFRGRTVGGRHVVIRRSRVADDMLDCNAVFVAGSERHRISEILGVFRHHPILTVSEVDGFCERGGMINFYIENERVRFEINMNAAQNAGLRLSSQLLKRARIVPGS